MQKKLKKMQIAIDVFFSVVYIHFHRRVRHSPDSNKKSCLTQKGRKERRNTKVRTDRETKFSSQAIRNKRKPEVILNKNCQQFFIKNKKC